MFSTYQATKVTQIHPQQIGRNVALVSEKNTGSSHKGTINMVVYVQATFK